MLGIEITHEQAQHLQKFAQGLLTQHHAIVELQNIQQEEIKAESNRRQGSTPFIERLDEYPSGGVDLTNLVDYPPKLKLIPVKPIFLDVAWNYIIYPGKIRQTTFDKDKNLQGEGSQPERKRGWWGFSRS